MILRRYLEVSANSGDLEAVADSMLAKPGCLDAHHTSREALLVDLRRYLSDPGLYLGAFTRGQGDEFFTRCQPFVPGREALVHLVGRAGQHFNDDEMVEGVGVLAEAFFTGYEIHRLTFPVIDIPGYPLRDRTERIFRRAGLRPEGVLREAAYPPGADRPCDLVLWGLLRSDRRA